jgi:hypothetical protein
MALSTQNPCEYQTRPGMQMVVGALKIVVRACPDLVCCVNPEQRFTLFVSVGLEYSA